VAPSELDTSAALVVREALPYAAYPPLLASPGTYHLALTVQDDDAIMGDQRAHLKQTKDEISSLPVMKKKRDHGVRKKEKGGGKKVHTKEKGGKKYK
jgi:hypothetical protein